MQFLNKQDLKTAANMVNNLIGSFWEGKEFPSLSDMTESDIITACIPAASEAIEFVAVVTGSNILNNDTAVIECRIVFDRIRVSVSSANNESIELGFLPQTLIDPDLPVFIDNITYHLKQMRESYNALLDGGVADLLDNCIDDNEDTLPDIDNSIDVAVSSLFEILGPVNPDNCIAVRSGSGVFGLPNVMNFVILCGQYIHLISDPDVLYIKSLATDSNNALHVTFGFMTEAHDFLVETSDYVLSLNYEYLANRDYASKLETAIYDIFKQRSREAIMSNLCADITSEYVGIHDSLIQIRATAPTNNSVVLDSLDVMQGNADNLDHDCKSEKGDK